MDSDKQTDYVTSREVDYISDLPAELMKQIFQYISDKEKIKLERVCKKWQAVLSIYWRNYSKMKIDSFLAHVELKNDTSERSFNFQDSSSSDVFSFFLHKISDNLQEISLHSGIFNLCASREALNFMLEMCFNLTTISLYNICSRDYENRNVDNYFSKIFNLEKLTKLTIEKCRLQDFVGSPFDTECFKCKLTHLKLSFLREDMVTEENLMPFCALNSETLESFTFTCTKTRYVQQIVNCILRLHHIKNVHIANLEFREFHSLSENEQNPDREFRSVSENEENPDIANVEAEEGDQEVNEWIPIMNDSFLADLGSNCPLLECVNLTESLGITSEGLISFINGSSKLRLLNVEFCPNIDNNIIKGLSNRSLDKPKLMIYAKKTNITYSSVNNNYEVIISDYCDNRVFF